MDRTGNDHAEGNNRGAPQEKPEIGKERETKEDGRYIIFYSFGDDEEER